MTKEQLEKYKNTYDCFDGIPSNEFDNICDELINYKNYEEQLGYPLEVIVKLKKANYIYRDDGIVFGFIGINFNDEDKLILYNDDECNTFTSDLKLTDYKITWWLKKDRSE